MLGAEEIGVREDFYGDGHPRIVSRIDRHSLGAAAKRFERLGLLSSVPANAIEAQTTRGIWCHAS